jgi:hypothetical protein
MTCAHCLRMRLSAHEFMTVLIERASALMRAEFSTVTFALMSSSIASSAVRLSDSSVLHARQRRQALV